MQNNILDEKVEETLVGIPPQPLISVARVIICLHCFYLISIKTLNATWAHWGLNEWLFLLLAIFAKNGFLIYYNVIHAIEESRGMAVTPKFSRAIVGLFMVLLAFQGLGYIGGFMIHVDYDFLNPLVWVSLTLIICTICILIRENKYYYWWRRQ